MNVSTITLSGLFNHAGTTVLLPPNGVVLVTGGNGAGKSSLVEAVAVAGWGKTLRGSEPWAQGQKQCSAHVGLRGAPALNIMRTRHGKRTELGWSQPGVPGVTYESTTKAQEALEHIIGPWDVWRRCAVFSSHDAAHFTRATDGERKRLLEEVLGMDRFDGALSACRADLKVALSKQDAARLALATLAERKRSEERRAADAATALAGLPAVMHPDATNTAALDAKVSKLRDMVDAAQDDLTRAREALRTADTAGAGYKATAAQLRRTLEAVRGEVCPTCTQRIPATLRESLDRAAVQASNAARSAEERAHADVADVEGTIAELQEEVRGLDAQLRAAQQAQRDVRQAAQQAEQMRRLRTQAERTAADAATALKSTDALLLDAEDNAAAASADAALFAACEQVLGLKGVRAQVLGQALGGIEAVANTWLQRLVGRTVRLRLLPYSEKKTGGVADSISLHVDGAGGGSGYAGSSGGERRRVDVALLLALAEVSAAAAGVAPGTLWFDEVFDTLDPDGAERASDVLHELAAERCVVVISHSLDVARSLNPDLRLRVEDGKVNKD